MLCTSSVRVCVNWTIDRRICKTIPSDAMCDVFIRSVRDVSVSPMAGRIQKRTIMILRSGAESHNYVRRVTVSST